MGTSTLRSPGIPDSQWIRVSPWRMGLPAGPPSVADFPLVLLVMTFGCLRSAPRQSFVPGLPTAAPSPSGPRRQTSRGRSRPCSATSTVPCSGGSARAARSPPDRLGADSALGDSSPLGFNEAASRGQRIRIVAREPRGPADTRCCRTIAECRVASMRPPAVASGYPHSTCSIPRVQTKTSMRPPARGQRIRRGTPAPRWWRGARFNEAASRGQRIRWSFARCRSRTFSTSMRPPAVASGYGTNRKYPTPQRLRIVLRALPHHDHTRAVASSPARCGRCHHLSARTSSAPRCPFKGFAHGTARHLRGCLDRA